MSDDKHKRVNHRVPEHVRDAAQDQTEHGELSELVRGLYRRVAFGEDVEQHETAKMELQRVRDEKDEKRSRIRELQTDLEALERKETRLEERVSEHQGRKQKYLGHLESIEGSLLDGKNVWTGHGKVQRAAQVAGCDTDAVIEDLKDRNPEIPDHAFRSAMDADESWDGVDKEVGT